MIQKININQKQGNNHISVLYPGATIGNSDTGIGSIGRIDQANIHGKTTIKMHPHVNDEILSYFRTGNVIHTDSSGITEEITRKKLMLMKAGKVFYHEEEINNGLEGLQIFIRPKNANDEPEVIFYNLDDEDSINAWRKLASNNNDFKLKFSSETEIFDISINNNEIYTLPESKLKNKAQILYVFQGSIIINNKIHLEKGESIVFEEDEVQFLSKKNAELVLFTTNKNQNCYKDGMFSGNKI